MADKQIGIRLNVQSTGLVQVDDALETISRNLKNMNEFVTQRQQKGWGTETQTKELREQLRYMQQMLQLTERMARTAGVHSDSFANYSHEIGLMQRDLGSTNSYKNGMSGWIHNRFGSQAAGGFERVSSYLGRGAALYGGWNVLSTIQSGLNAGTQLSYGYGDLAKRMAPNVNSQQYGINMSNALQGYGYSDQAILQSATMYGAATGRMDTNKFTQQMRSIEQVGRNYGLDLSGVTQYFSNAWTSGVTGGSQAEMRPQELANLTANAVIRGNMQGKEPQVMSQLQSIMQMNVATAGQAGDMTQLGGLLTLINKSGNQGLIANVGPLMNGFNNMIRNPGGGYAGQAMIWQALSKAHPGMSYFQLSDMASQGISGSGNLSAVLSYVSGITKNKDQQAYMLSKMGAGNQHVVKQFLDTAETSNGTFNQKAIDDFAKQAKTSPGNIPQNITDQYRNMSQELSHAADILGQNTVALNAPKDALMAKAVNAGGLPMYYGLSAIGAITAGSTAWKVGKGAVKIGKRIGSKLFSRGGGINTPVQTAQDTTIADSPVADTSIADTAVVDTATTTTGSVIAGGEAAAGTEAAMGVATGLEAVGAGADATGVGLPVGLILGLAGLVTAGGAGVYSWWKHKQQQSPKPAYGPPVPTQAQIQAGLAQTKISNAASGSELAPIVASTIIALAPYMQQLKPYLTGTSSNGKSIHDLMYRGQPQTTNDLVNRPNGINSPWSGLMNLNYNSNGMNGSSGTIGVGNFKAVAAPGSTTDAINYWSQKYGVPGYISYAIANAESGLRPDAEGDKGTSWGLFQLHQNGGQGTGYTAGQLKNPMLNAQIGLRSIAEAYKKAKSLGIPEGPQMAQWVAEHSGHPGGNVNQGVHSSLDDNIRNYAQQILGGTLKIQGANLNINVKQPDGSTSKHQVKIQATYAGQNPFAGASSFGPA
ncbi:transglycosylase SLT domain-containing protein [Fodinisporobacter ferrooxydans]|uniref:Transglycosylase SLT domain-containing protein n=1 Tax=Fodinisporobacter ferrooxydans TaxID=2901836 RepID=A0ABY4CJY9_9BACL|nr:transglycosylase SLT domain-containing protein [Alicyclobacillaceae bacterium MYW30-H2]